MAAPAATLLEHLAAARRCGESFDASWPGALGVALQAAASSPRLRARLAARSASAATALVSRREKFWQPMRIGSALEPLFITGRSPAWHHNLTTGVTGLGEHLAGMRIMRRSSRPG